MTARNLLTYLLAALLVTACSSKLSDTEFLEQAKDQIDKGEVRAASIQLKNALQQNPNNAEARWLLGKLYLELGSYAAAEKELRRALELGVSQESVLPLFARALLEQFKLEDVLAIEIEGFGPDAQSQILATQATALISQEKLDLAEQKITSALAKQPNSVPARIEQARLIAVKGELTEARNLINALLEDHDTNASAWNLLSEIERRDQQPEQAEIALTNAIKHSRANMTERMKRALVRIELKKYEDAQADIDLLKKRMPKHYELNYAQGLVHFYRERYPQAQTSFEAAIRANDQFLPAVFYLGATHNKLGQHQQADRNISRFVAANPGSIPGRKLLAEIRLKDGNLTEVERLVRPVLNHDDKDIDAINLLAAALIQQGELEEGIELLEKAVSLQPESAEAHLRLGSGLLQQGNEARGLELLDSAVQLDSDIQNSADTVLTRHYLENRKPEKALAVAKTFQQREPQLADPYNLIGLTHLTQRETEQAQAAFTRARELEPGNILANQSLAAVAMEQQQFTTARQRFEEILSHHPDHLDTLMRLSLLDERENREEEMVKHLQQAITAHPNAIQPRTSLARYYLSKGSPDKVAVALGELQQNQFNNPLVLDVLGRAQLAQGAAADAHTTFNNMVEVQPNSAQAHYLLSLAHAQLGDAQAVKKELETTISLDGDHLPARLALARLSLRQQDIEAAKRELAVLKAHAPGNPDVAFLEGSIAKATGRDEQALDLYTEVFENVSSTTNMLALAQQKWSMGDQDGTIILLETWLDQHPDDIASRLRLAMAYSNTQKPSAAIEQYETVLEQSNNNLVALNNLAWLLNDSDPKQALKYAEKANTLAPDSADIADTLALALMKNGEFERALRMSERALKISANDPTISYHKAMILDAMGHTQEAKTLLTSLLSQETDFPERDDAKQLLTRLKQN